MQLSCRMLVCFAHGQVNGVTFLMSRKYILSSLPSLTLRCLSMLYFVADYITYSRVLLNICNGRSGVRLPAKTRFFFSLHRADRPWGLPSRLLDNAYRDIFTDYDVFMDIHDSTAIVGLGLLYEVPLSHLDTPYSVGIFWMSDRPVTETST